MRFHHLGIACRDLDEALADLARVHQVRAVSETVYDPLQDASLRLVETAAGPPVELVAGAAVEGLLRRRISYYHLCFEVDDLAAESERLIAGGALATGPARPAVLFGGRLVRFFMTATGLIELLETTAP